MNNHYKIEYRYCAVRPAKLIYIITRIKGLITFGESQARFEMGRYSDAMEDLKVVAAALPHNAAVKAELVALTAKLCAAAATARPSKRVVIEEDSEDEDSDEEAKARPAHSHSVPLSLSLSL